MDGPGVGLQLGVEDPESSLGIGAMWGTSGVTCATWGTSGVICVISDTGGAGAPGSGVARGGEDVGTMSGVSGTIESLCYGRKSINRMRRP